MVFYFTGTGNSLYAAKQLEEEPVSIPQAMKREDLEFSAEAIGIVAPVYGHEVPSMVKEFLAKASFHTDYFYMVLTYGNRHGGAAELAQALCRSCGIEPAYINVLQMADNWLPSFDMEEQKRADKKVEEHLEKILEDVRQRKRGISQVTEADREAHRRFLAGMARMPEDIWTMEYETGKFPGAGIPMGAVITASGTGAEMNSGAVITYEEQLWNGPVVGTAASFAVLDPACTASVPAMQVLSGAFDTLSHAMETYLGNSDRDNVSDDVALAIMKNTVVNMRRLLSDMQDMQARGNLMWDSAMAENGILKVGRLTDFQAHQIEHQLGAYTVCNHGQGLAVIQPVYYRHILKEAEEKFARMGKEVFGTETGEEALDALAAFVRECGLPTKLSQLRSRREITPKLLRQVVGSCNIIRSNPRTLDRGEIYEILCECM